MKGVLDLKVIRLRSSLQEPTCTQEHVDQWWSNNRSLSHGGTGVQVRPDSQVLVRVKRVGNVTEEQQVTLISYIELLQQIINTDRHNRVP